MTDFRHLQRYLFSSRVDESTWKGSIPERRGRQRSEVLRTTSWEQERRRRSEPSGAVGVSSHWGVGGGDRSDHGVGWGVRRERG